MGYEPLHHKYRPQTFAQLVGQSAIATTLSSALSQQRIAPAYLFSGPRGTGKTSSARILAKSLNCIRGEVPTAEPCGVCEICTSITDGSSLDVIEIDAASNTGVDNIRELIERAQFAPVQCRYKVYIIDEVHMLSTAAFNALLKTLEEPPDRVVFVLATTDPQRVLPTIISRCQRFDFRRIALPEMIAHLGAIAQQESIEIADEALQLVAQVSQGGLRDAESLLDQLSLIDGQIVIEKVWDLVGAVPERDLLALVQAIASDNGIAVLDCARHLMDRGREPLIVLQNLAGFYRDLLIAKTAGDRQDLVAITPPTWKELCAFVQTVDLSTILLGQQHLRESEVQVKNTTQPRLWLEVILMGLLPSTLHPALPSGVPQATIPTIPVSGQAMSARGPAGGPVGGPAGAIASNAMPPVTPAPLPSASAPAPAPPMAPTAPPVPIASTPIASTPIAPAPSAPNAVAAPAHGTPPPQDLPPVQNAAPSAQSIQPLAPTPPATSFSPPSSVSSTPPNSTDVTVPPPTPSVPAPVPNNVAASPPMPAAEVAPVSAVPAPEVSTTSPSPTPVEAQTPTAPPVKTYTKEQLDQLWQQVTSLVKPPIAQTLFQQQGRLIAFDGRLANVAIKSKQLMRLAEQRIEKLSTAFEQVLHSSVRVTMEVAKAGDAAAASLAAAAAPASPVPPPPQMQPPPAPPTTPPQGPPPANYPPPAIPPAVSPAPTPIAPAAPVAAPMPSVPMPSVPVPSPPGHNGNGAGVMPPPPADNGSAAPLPPGGPTLPPIQNEDAETQSVKRFANMFNGEIVELDPQDLELLPPIQAAAQEAASGQPPQNGSPANGSAPTLPNNPPQLPAPEPFQAESSRSDRPYDPDVPF